MGRLKKWRKASAAHARNCKALRKHSTTNDLQDIECVDLTHEDSHDVEFTRWDGGVNHDLSDTEFNWDTDTSDDEYDDEAEPRTDVSDSNDDGFEELEGNELTASLEQSFRHEISLLNEVNAYDKILKSRTEDYWKKAEAKRGFGYTGNSERSKSRANKKARDKAAGDEKLRQTSGAAMMRAFVKPQKPLQQQVLQDPQSNQIQPSATSTMRSDTSESSIQLSTEIFTGYASDFSDDPSMLEDVSESEEERVGAEQSNSHPFELEDPTFSHSIRQPPPLKRRRLDVPARIAHQKAKAERRGVLELALRDIERVIGSKRMEFIAGAEGLQARRTRAIQYYLFMVVKNGRKGIDASERAAEVMKFSPSWGGRLVRRWVRQWIASRTLPESKRGQHIKSFSLLEDPIIRAELRSYLRSNKWVVNPAKLVEFNQNKMIPEAADKYLCKLVDDEMPRGLKQYMEVELFPRIQLKVGKGVSLKTARRFLKKEGFRYTAHKKGLYFDGHERPDVVDYCQNHFLPRMAKLRHRLVEYQVGNVEEELEKIPHNYVERRLVLVPQDEMTAQANDGQKSSWVHEDEHALLKKGAGRGLHQSDVTCSTFGWIEEASQTMEYGKNYEGYWTGEMFVKQLIEKIIPAFERLHGPGYQALIMVDNSQGHSAYGTDALLVSRMNLRPGGKQAHMRNGWFVRDGVKILQPMIFPSDHPTFPNQPKGIKQVLLEHNLWNDNLSMQCKKCSDESETCCAKKILSRQPDFLNQASLVQEVIEKAGHLCIVLPKFHCELNPIEFFWGATKHYLRDNCDYTFATLQKNMPKALKSVNLHTIRKWEHRMYRWMDAYRDGLSAKDAQLKVKQFSSRKYTSHRRVPESLARAFDA